MRALQVDALAGGIGSQQHLHLRIVPEGFLRLEPGLAAHAAMNQHGGLGASEQGRDAIVQVAQGVPVFGEQDQLLPRRRGRPGNLDRRHRGRPAPRLGQTTPRRR